MKHSGQIALLAATDAETRRCVSHLGRKDQIVNAARICEFQAVGRVKVTE